MNLFKYIYLPLFFVLFACNAQPSTETVTVKEQFSPDENKNGPNITPQKILGDSNLSQPEEKSVDTIDSGIDMTKTETIEESDSTFNQSIKEEEEENEEVEKMEKKDSINDEIVQIVEEPHIIWDKLTRKHISSGGKVNYAGFLSDKKELEQYLNELKEMYSNLANWNRKKQLAFWINTYNAVTIKLIVDNYPVSSITDLEGGKPWDTELIELGGVQYTLNVIENKIIRPKFNEPRIHFAVNCAAKSCPKIMNKAWTEHNLDRSLTAQTKAFLANKEQNTIKENEVILSKIFEWYKSDFGTSNENIIQFINQYSSEKVNSKASVSFNEYDWTLNTK